MSILKSILHHYNKTSASYDTLHPETEVAQITDWSQGIVNTLASTALGSLISTLSSDSLMAKLMKLVFDATGVKYLMDTNGYICFGSLFGGLIIQWETAGTTSFSEQAMYICFTDRLSTACHSALQQILGVSTVIYGVEITSAKSSKVYSSVNASDWGCAFVIAIGK